MRTILLASLATIGLVGLVGSARAEQGTGSPGGSPACRQEDQTQPVTTRVERINGKPTMVIDKVIVVCGHPARPAVAYVTSAKDVDYTWTQLTDFLGALAPNPASKIVESVKQLGGRK